ncbi:MAG: asparagine synthase (glutamine-hydrolyzing) [Bacteroidetes bacterium RIFCSPLOWO2_02_FULL_36_8]|nr:MAG: asparagine synthase (glutamine-hydrolyzing) [Bacteroidetes bacterium RIFCSPLOWO2_02_FULL_36_8]OFY71003.1 MAG: asparagine synthase (glutamine-hydrolyzing) [Bacteroidetes bacterium RIFCSPLOWO2_12_FULL_37_12]
MCGILASVNHPFGNETLNMIAHRGPDDYGIENFDLAGNKIIFGHRRLSIIDLTSAGHQPMISDCGNYSIIFNGEIYNHADLRQKLPSVNFKGHSDTETILYYFIHFGIKSIGNLNGIFAFAFLDKINQKIYLVRDRFGVKPLYYYHFGKSLILSSEIRPIRQLVSTTIDKNSLAELLRLRYNPSPHTLFKDIKKVRPGHYLEYDLQKGTLLENTFISPVIINHQISFRDALQQYEFFFENAIKRQLLADVEIGVLLSGGIDSALVTHYAQKYYGKKIKTFTVGFQEQSEANELIEAQKTAEFIGTDHYEVSISSVQFSTILRKCISIIEEPLGTTSIIPMYFLNELVKKHLKVVLTGQGADEPLGGYPRYQGELWRQHLPAFLFKAMKALSHQITNEKLYRASNSLAEKEVVKRFDKIYALFTTEEINSLIGQSANSSIEKIKYFYELLEGYKQKPVEAMMSLDLRMNLADDLLLYTDKVSMHYSIETRVPLLDNELVTFLESLPYQYRLKIGQGKFIHKKFAEKILPPSIVYRKKKGFSSPTDTWFKSNVGEKFYKMLTEPGSKFAGYFDIRTVDKIFKQHFQHKLNKEKQIFTLISLYYWMEDYL